MNRDSSFIKKCKFKVKEILLPKQFRFVTEKAKPAFFSGRFRNVFSQNALPEQAGLLIFKKETKFLTQ